MLHFLNLKIWFQDNLPTVISSYAPHPNRMNRLCVQYSEILWIDQLERAFVQIHK